MAEGTPLTIGEVINLLRDEFPDVTVSKVWFLESQGLLTPGRSESGYRLFDDTEIERLRFILRQQRDHFLPLKVIKSKLTLWERGEDDGEGAVSGGIGTESAGQPADREELLRRSGLSPSLLGELIDAGIVTAVDDDGEHFPPEAVTVAREARRLFELGLEPRHLKVVLHAAQREADLVTQLVAPLLALRQPEAREQARAVLATSVDAITALHRALLGGQARELLES